MSLAPAMNAIPSQVPSEQLDLSNEIRCTSKHYVSIGEYSDLWLGEQHQKNGISRKVALKLLRGGSSTRGSFVQQINQDIRRHGIKWIKLKYPYVAEFYGFAYNIGPMPALVLPYFANGNIMEYTKKKKKPDSEKFTMVCQIASALQYLHENGVVHGDLRGANIMVNDLGEAVVIDYGLAFIVQASEFTSIKTAGTCRWTAPEIMNPDESDSSSDSPTFSEAGDIFAFAMTFVEIITGQHPFAKKKNDSAVIFAILASQRPDLPEFIAAKSSLEKLVEECWNQDPRKRPSANDVVQRLTTEPPVSLIGWLFNSVKSVLFWM